MTSRILAFLSFRNDAPPRLRRRVNSLNLALSPQTNSDDEEDEDGDFEAGADEPDVEDFDEEEDADEPAPVTASVVEEEGAPRKRRRVTAEKGE